MILNLSTPLCILSLVLPAVCLVRPEIQSSQTSNSFHLPLYKRTISQFARRGAVGSIGLGDYQDITYSVRVKIGETEIPLTIDTGSSDLWVISDACHGDASCSVPGVALYPQATFQYAGLDTRLFYGDSQTGTHAFGGIGRDTTGIAGLSIQNQYFAAINDTNTTVSQTGSAGLFGLGFPVNSVIWSELFKYQFPHDTQPPTKRSDLRMTKFSNAPVSFGGYTTRRNAAYNLPTFPDYRRTKFPDLTSLLPSRATFKRQVSLSSSGPSLTDLLNSFATNGPLLARLVAQGALLSPQFTITLQRDSVQIGGNVGVLSVGELPPGISNESLTWVSVRGYTAQQGGINSPTDIYPIAWEVPIDDVFLDGQKLQPSKLAPGISVSALIDTGNSLIRGPQDVVQALTTAITGSGTASVFDCVTPHTLTFQIGGKMFPIDPRDFIQQAQRGNIHACSSNVVSTDPPRDGFLYSWSLGDPFLKSNLVSFYFGNLTHPSVDPPRVGFLSTVQSDAGAQLKAAVANAQPLGYFPAITESAPASGPSMATTLSGLPLVPTPGLTTAGHKNQQIKVRVTRYLTGAGLFVACALVW